MSRRTRRLALGLAAAMVVHEVVLVQLAQTDPISALFSFGPDTPVAAIVVALALLMLRVALYFVLPYAVLFSALTDALARRPSKT
jgi:hypothetical protein